MLSLVLGSGSGSRVACRQPCPAVEGAPDCEGCRFWTDAELEQVLAVTTKSEQVRPGLAAAGTRQRDRNLILRSRAACDGAADGSDMAGRHIVVTRPGPAPEPARW